MKSYWSLAPVLATALMLASAPTTTTAMRRSSSPMASPPSVVMASTRTRGSKDNINNKEKTKKDDGKPKSLWPFGKSKEIEQPQEEEEKDEEKPQKQQGPFGLFRKRPNDEKKEESGGEQQADKRKEKKQKTQPTNDSGESKSKPDETKPSDKEKTEEKDEDEKKDLNEESDDKEQEKTDDEAKSDQEKAQDEQVRRVMERQRQQQMAVLRPYSVVYGQNPGSSSSQRVPSGVQRPQSELMVISALSSILVLATRFFVVNWMVSKLQFDWDLKRPRQHFMWECLNDKFVRDDVIWNSVRGRPPQSMPFSSRKWHKIVKGMGPERQKRKNEEPPTPSRTVVVIELDTQKNQDSTFSDFADMVSFLASANGRNKQIFGSEPEVILNIFSSGGEVTSFALAAAHVKRLRMAGWKVTACVDRFAASGGYMIASQASQILAAPFAIVGSIGVIMENLNFFEALKNHGVKTINLKAGDMKNPVSRFGEVTDKDLKLKQKDLEDAHRDFIELCRSSRPDLDPEVCNGRVLSGEKALETGMLDRILTSEEYIYEKISDGDLVMKIHLVSPYSEQLRFARILQILPHFQHKMRSALSLLSGGRFSGFSELRYAKFNIDTNTFNNIATGVALASMIQNAIQRSQFGKKKG